jgi:transcriptional regulator with XRE-family HTH domain
MSNTGEKIKQIRIARGFTQQELADRIGVKRNTFSQWESGARNISVDQLKDLARAVGVTLDYFQDNPPERTLFQLMTQLEGVFTDAGIPEIDKDKAYQDIMKIYLKSKENSIKESHRTVPAADLLELKEE